MSFTTFLRILQARWFSLLATTLLSLIGAALLTMSLPKSYKATTELLIDGSGQDPISGQVMPAQRMSAYIATQSEVMSSRNVANKVIDRLALLDRPELQHIYREKTAGKVPKREWLQLYLKQHLSVANKRDSNVMSVEISLTDPTLAAELADAVANAYIDTNLELRTEPAKRIAIWYDQQLAELRQKLGSAQEALTAYQEKFGIVAVNERLDLESARLAELSSMLVAAQGQRLDNQSRRQQLKNSDNSIPADLLGNPLTKELRSNLAKAQARLDELSTQVGARHPQYIQASREVAALKTQLSHNLELLGGSIRSSAALSEDLEKQLTAELATQKERVLKLNRNRDELSLLKQELDSAQSAYNSALERSTQTQLESRLAMTDIAILNSATIPMHPSSPNPAMNLLIATILGILLGIAIALIREWADQRVRNSEELEERLGLPVLANIPATHRRWIQKGAVA